MLPTRILPPFSNEPPLDFSIEAIRLKFSDALASLDVHVNHGILAAPLIGGKAQTGGEKVASINPSTEEVMGMVSFATENEAVNALAQLITAKNQWGLTSVAHRSSILREAGRLMREQRYDLAALLVCECGKPWKDADGEVAEAIDFCFYYADQADFYGDTLQTSSIPGESNRYFYQPRGLSVVISPWNFPLAIACGMVVASLVTGNCVAFKPAEQTSLIGQQLIKILLAAGFPSDVIAFLPGSGEVIGNLLVTSPHVDLICFTGSKDVGLSIIQKAAITSPEQRSIKRVIAELGGKNAIIVDEDADIDEAIKGILYSAFGYAGQKCSAASRLIIVGSLYNSLLSRLNDAINDLIVDSSLKPSTFVGPVIDRETQLRLLELRAQFSAHYTMMQSTHRYPQHGYFVPPTFFKDVPTSSALWTDELFGPFLAACPAPTFKKALEIANESPYALTGGVYSRSPRSIQDAYQSFSVGNLYINRPCTGALVGRQPFGGFRLSGVGSKAGGPDYLLQFMEPRVISENTMRRGFVPDIL